MDDKEFNIKLLSIFRIEAEEHLKAISDGLIALEGDLPQDQCQKIIETIFREAHSLKGAARSVNQQAIEKVCQVLENILAAWKQKSLRPSHELFNTLYATIDILGSALSVPPDQNVISTIIQKLEAVTTSPSSENIHSLIAKENQDQKNVKPEKQREPPLQLSEGEQPKEPILEPEVEELEKPKKPLMNEALKEKTIRISLLKMNRLFQETEEMLIIKRILQQEVINFRQLLIQQNKQKKEFIHLLSKFENSRQILQYKKNPQDQEVIHKILPFLEQQQHKIKTFQESLYKFIKTSEHNTRFVEVLIDNLLEDMKKVLMQPLSTLFEVMPRMIRDIASELKKEVRIEFKGGDIEIDRRILEEIKDPLIHLIRNAIDHGIESPTQRIKANKTSFGSLKIIAEESNGNSVKLFIIDDGKGIDIQKLKELTIQQGLLSKKEAADLKDEDAIKLAFHSGISTSSTVTSLSGRGLGLGIVLEKVDKLQGQILVNSIFNQGTTFTLILPSTLATFRGIHLTVANQDFIMPTHNVKRVLRIKKEEIKIIASCETISVDHSSIPFIHLADVLELKNKKQTATDFQFVLLVTALDKTIAFGADSIHREQEVLVKSLGNQCVRIRNIMAATVMEYGNVIPVLNPIDLIQSAIKGNIKQAQAVELQEERFSQKEILIVEDSMTTRLLLKNILETAGYHVKTAVDGVEALEFLNKQKVDLILTDVEMPRMDGFTLLEKVKETIRFQGIPIIICTSRGSREDRERGIELGASAYLDKSQFTQQELLQLLKKIL